MVTILILVDGFLQYWNNKACSEWDKVTILILVDGFLQYYYDHILWETERRHNPYFSRWFSAIKEHRLKERSLLSHNPYFSRWFSAICVKEKQARYACSVTILILVDGFLQ